MAFSPTPRPETWYWWVSGSHSPDRILSWSSVSGTHSGKIPLCQTPSLAPGNPSGRDHPAVSGWLHPREPERACHHPGILLLRPSGADLPKGWRKCLCQHHVYRKSEKRHCRSFRLHAWKKATPASSGLMLLRHYFPVCHWRRNWRQTFNGLRRKSHLGIQHPASHQLPFNVYWGNRRGRTPLAVRN